MENADKILFRASSIGNLMVEPRSKNELLAEGVITHLVDVFVSAKYKRREDVHGKFINKGNERENEAITLFSRVKKIYFIKNSERFSNDYITGEPDLFLIKEDKVEEIIDIKTSWSAHTFFRTQQKKLSRDYYWQGLSYMALTGAKKCTIAFCLVNGTFEAIMNEKRRASYSYGMDFENDPEYVKECQQIERNHIFNMEAFQKECMGFDFHSDLNEWKYDIPKEDRVFTFSFDRDEDAINKLYSRIADCRTWMNTNLFKIEVDEVSSVHA